MAMNRVQFQRGMGWSAFQQQFGTEELCRRALEAARWPNGFYCPRCDHREASVFVRDGERLWQCRGCRRQTSLTAGTVFAESKLGLQRWFVALYLLTQSKTNVAALELMRHLGVCYRTAHRIKHKLMQAMLEDESGRRLGVVVQMDDAYLGGRFPGGKPGRGSPNKQPFVIAVSVNDDGHPQEAVIEPVIGFTTAALTEWSRRRLMPDAEVFSDGLGAFRAVVAEQHAHTVLQASSPREATETPGARWVNVVLGNLKRALDGSYHAIRQKKYAHRYLAEAAWRFNHRFRMDSIFLAFLLAAVDARPMTEAALRTASMFGS